MKHLVYKPREWQRGQSLVELALMLPLLMMLLLGTIDFGRAFYIKIAIDSAARVGAEYAIDPRWPVEDSGPTPGIKTIVIREAASYVTINASDITVQRAPSQWDSSKYDATVSIAYTFTPYAPYTKQLWGGGDLILRTAATTRQMQRS